MHELDDGLGLAILKRSTAGRPEVRVAVIDGPVDLSHPDFGEARVVPLGGAASCSVKDSPGCEHGTFVAGVIAASRSGKAPALCPGCTLLVRPIFCEATDFGQCPVVTVAELARALDEAVDARADVINLSVGLVGGGADMAPLYRAYDRARDADAILVAALGNEAGGGPRPLLAHPWVIGVAAADGHGRSTQVIPAAIAPQVVLAPGVDVLSTAPGEGYRTMSGTSSAAPFVTGTLALLRSLHPTAEAAALRDAVLATGSESPGLLSGEGALERLEDQLEPTPEESLTMATTESPTETTNETPSVPAAQPDQAAPPVSDASPAVLAPAQVAPAQTCTDVSAFTQGSYVYAFGTIKPTFPSLDVRKEFERLASKAQPPVSPDDFYTVLDQNPYIADYLCWVLEIGNVDTYVLKPRSRREQEDMIQSLKQVGSSFDGQSSIVVGPMGSPADPGLCNGLQVPMVLVNQVYYFDFNDQIAQISKEYCADGNAVNAVLKAMELKPNPGESNQDRAYNYLAFRYPEIYIQTCTLQKDTSDGPYFLVSISTRPSPVQVLGSRDLVDVIFKYQNPANQQEKFYFCSVDVTGQFPFLNTALRPYIPEGG